MIRGIFLTGLIFLSANSSSVWAGDCSQFISDFKNNKIAASKTYQFESDQLYFPAEYCPFSPLNFVSDQNNYAEFYLVEQCRETRYLTVKTTLMCREDPKAAKVRSSCEVNGRLLSPCLKSQLAEALAPKEPA